MTDGFFGLKDFTYPCVFLSGFLSDRVHVAAAHKTQSSASWPSLIMALAGNDSITGRAALDSMGGTLTMSTRTDRTSPRGT